MKKILITGAAGEIGLKILEYLVSENKYEITALDLKNKKNNQKLKKYQKKINLVYGDVSDPVLIDALIKDHNYIIHLAGIMPPLCNLTHNLGKEIDYKGTQNLVRSISFFNPQSVLIYPSSTTIYEKKAQEISLNNKIKIESDDYYSQIKEKCENLIKENIKNYIIFRIPFILGNLTLNETPFLYKRNESLELITLDMVANSFVWALQNIKSLNKKTKILSGGVKFRMNSNELQFKILENYGLTFSIIWSLLFNPYEYHGNIFKEDKKIINKEDSLEQYFATLKESSKNINRFLAKPLKRKIERSLKK